MSMKVVELFAGVGGFRLGLEKASKDFEVVFANQWEPGKSKQHAFDCYINHYGEIDSHINENISLIKSLVPKHDLLVGGFPCQDYSVAATGAKGIEGVKGVLWWEIRDIVEMRRPKFILLENVDRLIKSPAKQRGRDFGIILKSLNDLGYAIEWRVIKASDYGNAQRRRRVFIFAVHSSTKKFKELRKHKLDNVILHKGLFATAFNVNENSDKKRLEFNVDKYSDLVEMTQSFKQEFRNSGFMIDGIGQTIEVLPKSEIATPLKNIIHENTVDNKFFLTLEQINKFDYLRGSKSIERTKPNGEKYYYSEGSMSKYDNLSLPGRTMLTSEGTTNRSTHIIQDFKTNKLRLLTPIECERLNGFDDNWTNTGMPQRFRYFCMGNALVVPLVTRLGKVIVKFE